jgi:hypothetical protein
LEAKRTIVATMASGAENGGRTSHGRLIPGRRVSRQPGVVSRRRRADAHRPR